MLIPIKGVGIFYKIKADNLFSRLPASFLQIKTKQLNSL